jgi:hypothetical protein
MTEAIEQVARVPSAYRFRLPVYLWTSEFS